MIKLNIVTCMDWTKFSPFNFVLQIPFPFFVKQFSGDFFFGRCCRGEGLHNSEGGLERINQTWATTPPSLHPSLLLLFGWHQKHKNTEFIQQGDKKAGCNCSTESQISTANPGSNIEVVQLKPLVNLHIWYQQIILNRYKTIFISMRLGMVEGNQTGRPRNGGNRFDLVILLPRNKTGATSRIAISWKDQPYMENILNQTFAFLVQHIWTTRHKTTQMDCPTICLSFKSCTDWL